jgi:hypothetical protein
VDQPGRTGNAYHLLIADQARPGPLTTTGREHPVVRILAITVEYQSGVPGDVQPVLVGLPELRRHCRAERVDDLIDDLVMLVEDVEAARPPAGAVLSVIHGGAR